jgi:hypothetical protein
MMLIGPAAKRSMHQRMVLAFGDKNAGALQLLCVISSVLTGCSAISQYSVVRSGSRRLSWTDCFSLLFLAPLGVISFVVHFTAHENRRRV